MKRKSILLLTGSLLFLSIHVTAQFHHGIGLTLNQFIISSGSPYDYLPRGVFTYYPRYNIAEYANSSISIGAPLGVGVSIRKPSYSDKVLVSLSLDLPLVIDYNVGVKSTGNNTNKWGGYVGTGFGYFRFNPNESLGTTNFLSTYGPMIRAGLRIPAPAKRGNPVITLGTFFKLGLESQKLSTFGVSILYEFK